MNNVETIIKTINKQTNKARTETDKCNCRNKSTCPLPGRCTVKEVVYQATIKTEEETKQYIGITANTFKTRYTQHKASFTHQQKRHQTALSTYIWKLKDTDTPHEIKWEIIKAAKPYTTTANKCNLCLSEKYHIITANKETSLNSRNELFAKCPHKRKHLLSELKWK